MSNPRVLHVLPHTGAGAQTYIDLLSQFDGYDFETFELSASRSLGSAAASIAGRQSALFRAARRADLLHFHGEVASILSLPLLTANRSVITLHGLHLLRRLSPGIPQHLGRLSFRAVVRGAQRTICVSRAEREDLQWLPGGLRAKLVVIRNGLSLPSPVDAERRVRVRNTLGLAEDSVAVLYLGQLEPRKDPLTLVAAARRAHGQDARITLLVAGDGPSAVEVAGVAGAETLLLGERRHPSDLLAAADIFVMPSLREGLSYAVLEALGHGVATVVSDAPGNPEAVGDAGLVFPAGDDVRLSALLLQLAADPGRRAALGAAGRARVAADLSAEQMLAGTRAVYDGAVMAPAPGSAAALA